MVLKKIKAIYNNKKIIEIHSQKKQYHPAFCLFLALLHTGKVIELYIIILSHMSAAFLI